MREFLAIHWSHQNTLWISWDYPFKILFLAPDLHITTMGNTDPYTVYVSIETIRFQSINKRLRLRFRLTVNSRV
jgi:hypothetical protein